MVGSILRKKKLLSVDITSSSINFNAIAPIIGNESCFCLVLRARAVGIGSCFFAVEFVSSLPVIGLAGIEGRSIVHER